MLRLSTRGAAAGVGVGVGVNEWWDGDGCGHACEGGGISFLGGELRAAYERRVCRGRMGPEYIHMYKCVRDLN